MSYQLMPEIVVKFTADDLESAKILAKKRVRKKPLAIRYNSSGYHRVKKGDDPDKAARWYPHFIGLLGEVAYGSLMSLRVNDDVRKTGDEADFGETEIKTRCCKDRNPLLMVNKREFDKKSPKEYILVRLEPDYSHAELLGKITKDSFGKMAEIMKRGEREIMTVRAEDLGAM